MTPQGLARRHPHLYHLTTPGAFAGMLRHGLRSVSSLLRLYGIPDRAAIETSRRPAEIVLETGGSGPAVISDNLPLNVGALAACLDDGLTPADWLRVLNARVFFWPTEARLESLLNARMNRQRDREVLIINTLSFATAYAAAIDLSPINTGATLRRAGRRGIGTFSPLSSASDDAWPRYIIADFRPRGCPRHCALRG
jgi:hypothetical protein